MKKGDYAVCCRLCGESTKEYIISGLRVCLNCYKLILKYKTLLRGKGYIEEIDNE